MFSLKESWVIGIWGEFWTRLPNKGFVFLHALLIMTSLLKENIVGVLGLPSSLPKLEEVVLNHGFCQMTLYLAVVALLIVNSRWFLFLIWLLQGCHHVDYELYYIQFTDANIHRYNGIGCFSFNKCTNYSRSISPCQLWIISSYCGKYPSLWYCLLFI